MNKMMMQWKYSGATMEYVQVLEEMQKYVMETGEPAWLISTLETAKQAVQTAFEAALATVYARPLDRETIAELDRIELEVEDRIAEREAQNGKGWVPDATDEQEGRRAQHGTDGSSKGIQ